MKKNNNVLKVVLVTFAIVAMAGTSFAYLFSALGNI